jgi:hypothetical protein
MAPAITPDFMALMVSLVFGILLLEVFPVFWVLFGASPFFLPYYELNVSGKISYSE